jgi:hypothetical protein
VVSLCYSSHICCWHFAFIGMVILRDLIEASRHNYPSAHRANTTKVVLNYCTKAAGDQNCVIEKYLESQKQLLVSLFYELTNSISIVISRERGERVLEERLAADNAGDTEASPRGHGTAED